MKDEHQHDTDEAAIRKLILDEWSRKRIVNFCTHLMGDRCQVCAAEECGVSALQTANSRYVTALGVLQDFYEWAGRVEPNGFETWCKQRLNAANRAALHT